MASLPGTLIHIPASYSSPNKPIFRFANDGTLETVERLFSTLKFAIFCGLSTLLCFKRFNMLVSAILRFFA